MFVAAYSSSNGAGANWTRPIIVNKTRQKKKKKKKHQRKHDEYLRANSISELLHSLSDVTRSLASIDRTQSGSRRQGSQRAHQSVDPVERAANKRRKTDCEHCIASSTTVTQKPTQKRVANRQTQRQYRRRRGSRPRRPVANRQTQRKQRIKRNLSVRT